jgi:murein DD-endopeptidase MepM/ murein hydrolase activator NlpD
MRRRVLLVLAGVLAVLGALPGPATADDPSDELARVQEEIAALTGQIESAETQRSDVARDLSAAQARVEEVFAELTAAQTKVDEKQAEIDAAEARIAELQVQIDELLRQLAATRVALTSSRSDLEVQVVELYMNASSSVVASVLTFGSAADVAIGITYTDDIAGESESIIRGFVALEAEEKRQQEMVEARQADVEATLVKLEADRVVLEADLATVAELQDEANQHLAEVRSLLDRVNADIRAYEAEKDGLEADSARLEAEIQAQTSNEGTNPGVIGWPVSGPVTSGFGYRVHPIFGTRKLHTGVDIGVGSGTPIAAAESGTVILAQVYGGYGNAVVIDHGGGLTTLYAHQSSIAVSAGQSVSRGDLVGYVGCTGFCTGPHLHFETRESGSPVDPMKYLG